MSSLSKERSAHATILDIRRDELQDTLAHDIRRLLHPAGGGEKSLPTLLLYDEAGLKLFEEITYLDEYYLTNAEIQVLERYAHKIAERIPDGAMVVELGSGNLRKVSILLSALNAARKNIDYYALDLMLPELERTLAAVPPGKYENVRCHGLHGTYDDGLAWLKQEQNSARPKCIITLGSSVGNFDVPGAAAFLGTFAKGLKSHDVLIVGVDSCQDPDRVYHAYNDRHGTTHRFVLNGLVHANRVLGKEAFTPGDWSVIGEYDTLAGRHHAFVTPSKDVDVEGAHIVAGERVRIEESYKYSPIQVERLWKAAGLACGASFGDSTGTYHVNMLSKADFTFSLDPKVYAKTAIPTWADWQHLWGSWDLATRRMLPEAEMLHKPIKLRNCCVFYLGHIPTFLDMHLTRCLKTKPTPPEHYPTIFERGIDPDVDNPEQCHAHSEIPDEWPPLEEILAFQEGVRARIKALYEDGTVRNNAPLRRVLNLGFEHEVMHLETFLYMLLQSDYVQPPTSIAPDFAALAEEAAGKAVSNKWFRIPASNITVGRDDDQHNYDAGHYFGWDVENPARSVNVHEFEAQARPLTNAEYARYMMAKGVTASPASWTTDSRPDSGYSGSRASPDSDEAQQLLQPIDQEAFEAFIRGKAVRTMYGAIPLKFALDWPVWASYDELARCAAFFGGRIPTLEEARSIYAFAEQQRLEDLGHYQSPVKIPAVNGHLSNNGVHQTPPHQAPAATLPEGADDNDDSLSPRLADKERATVFADLADANVGFTHFHPTPVTADGGRLAGLAQMGGVWEWTSSPLEAHDGYVPMDLYPAYSSDFFDGKHNIVLGGSWATHPRVAGRKTL